VKVAKQEETTIGGIVLPVSAQKKPTSGVPATFSFGHNATHSFFQRDPQVYHATFCITALCGTG
jgi:co-chaperonin GroES (HSP10)